MLDNLTRPELEDLAKQVDRRLKAMDGEARKVAIRAAEDAAAAHGYSLSALTTGKKAPKLNPARYRNPDDPSQTWTGKGRQPKWFKAAVASGVAPEAMEIDG